MVFGLPSDPSQWSTLTIPAAKRHIAENLTAIAVALREQAGVPSPAGLSQIADVVDQFAHKVYPDAPH